MIFMVMVYIWAALSGLALIYVLKRGPEPILPKNPRRPMHPASLEGDKP